MRISDWSSDVCSSDLVGYPVRAKGSGRSALRAGLKDGAAATPENLGEGRGVPRLGITRAPIASVIYRILTSLMEAVLAAAGAFDTVRAVRGSAALMLLADLSARSEEHTSELQSLIRISYAVSCLKNKQSSKK